MYTGDTNESSTEGDFKKAFELLSYLPPAPFDGGDVGVFVRATSRRRNNRALFAAGRIGGCGGVEVEDLEQIDTEG